MILAADIEAIVALVLVFVGISREWASPDVLALSGAALLLALGVLSTGELLGVFSNSGPLTIGAMFVISGALQSTGVIELLRTALSRLVDGRSPLQAVGGLLVGVMVASAFISNTAVVVILTPVVIALARRLSRPPSRCSRPEACSRVRPTNPSIGGSCS